MNLDLNVRRCSDLGGDVSSGRNWRRSTRPARVRSATVLLVKVTGEHAR